jgi:uncharacterized protein
MLLIKTKIGPSKINGIGLFADQFIPKGTVVWKFKNGFDIRFDENYPKTLEEPVRSYFATYTYQNPKTKNYVLCADNDRFCNHSDNPNIGHIENPEDEDPMDIALSDIQPGEEMTLDYSQFDANPFFGFEK